MTRKPTYEELEQRVKELEREVYDKEQTSDTLQFMQYAMDHSSDAAFWIGPDARFINVNETACRALGYSRKELLEMTVHDIAPGFPQETWSEHWTKAKRKGSFLVESQHLTKDGGLIPVEILINHVKFGGGEYHCTFARDISERKCADQALRESETKYSTLVENSKDGIIMIQDGLLNFVNRASLDIVGYSPEELIGKNFLLFIAPKHRELVFQRYTDRLGGKEVPSIYEIELLRKDSTTIPIELKAMTIQFEGKPADLAVLRDITDRRKAGEALQQSEERYRSLVENTFDGYYIFEIPSKRLLFLNQRSCDLFGYTMEEALSLTIFDVIAPEGHGRIQKHIKAWLDSKEIIAEHQIHKAVRKDGSFFQMEVSSSFITFQGRRSIQGVIRDITEQECLQRQLQEAKRLEAIGTLAGGIAHDFNNLLMGIQGNVSLLLLDIDMVDPRYDKLKKIEQHIKSGSNLTKQILGFARGGKYEVIPTDLNEIIENSSEMFGRTKKEIAIHRKYQEDIWTAEIDRSQIEQVLLNLYVNAWHAMPAGGHLFLETENVILNEDDVRPYGIEPDKYVKISVTDSGTGMDEATQQRIFDPFFTTKEMGRGTGLGLASTYGIIKNHDGIITVYSKKAQGTTFNIYLPVSEKAALKERLVDKDLLEGIETVLLVDDEDMVIDVGEQMLERMGYKVLLAGSGKDALEVYKKNSDKVALIILDMIMPDMNGGETYDSLKKINPHIKVLLSSGYSIDGKAQGILDRGCNAFIQKPFTIKDLSGKIREVLDH